MDLQEAFDTSRKPINISKTKGAPMTKPTIAEPRSDANRRLIECNIRYCIV